jgi:hypothetical protein
LGIAVCESILYDDVFAFYELLLSQSLPKKLQPGLAAAWEIRSLGAQVADSGNPSSSRRRLGGGIGLRAAGRKETQTNHKHADEGATNAAVGGSACQGRKSSSALVSRADPHSVRSHLLMLAFFLESAAETEGAL